MKKVKKEIRYCICCKTNELDCVQQKYCIHCSLFTKRLRRDLTYYKSKSNKLLYFIYGTKNGTERIRDLKEEIIKELKKDDMYTSK